MQMRCRSPGSRTMASKVIERSRSVLSRDRACVAFHALPTVYLLGVPLALPPRRSPGRAPLGMPVHRVMIQIESSRFSSAGSDSRSQAVRDDSSSWHPKEPKWFRGERQGFRPLLPSLYRKGLAAYENPLLQMLRVRASGYHDVVPDRKKPTSGSFQRDIYASPPAYLIGPRAPLSLCILHCKRKARSFGW